MANGKILRQLFKAGSLGDQAAFRRASEAIIEEERQKQHHLLANDLEQILYGGDMHVNPHASRNSLSIFLSTRSGIAFARYQHAQALARRDHSAGEQRGNDRGNA